MSVDFPLGATTKSSNNFELKLAKKAGCKGATKRRKQAEFVADFGSYCDQKIWALDNRFSRLGRSEFGAAKDPRKPAVGGRKREGKPSSNPIKARYNSLQLKLSFKFQLEKFKCIFMQGL